MSASSSENPSRQEKSEPKDAGFKRAMFLGLLVYVFLLVCGFALLGRLPAPETLGSLGFGVFVASLVVGMFVNGRNWPWWKIGVVYAVAGFPILGLVLLQSMR